MPSEHTEAKPQLDPAPETTWWVSLGPLESPYVSTHFVSLSLMNCQREVLNVPLSVTRTFLGLRDAIAVYNYTCCTAVLKTCLCQICFCFCFVCKWVMWFDFHAVGPFCEVLHTSCEYAWHSNRVDSSSFFYFCLINIRGSFQLLKLSLWFFICWNTCLQKVKHRMRKLKWFVRE